MAWSAFTWLHPEQDASGVLRIICGSAKHIARLVPGVEPEQGRLREQPTSKFLEPLMPFGVLGKKFVHGVAPGPMARMSSPISV